MRRLMFDIADNDERILYYIHGDEESGYGFEIAQIDERYISSSKSNFAFKNKNKAEEFLKEMYKGRVYPIHLMDIIEDETENINKAQ